MHTGRRVAMAVVGVASLCVYVLAAIVGYRLIVELWARRPSPAVAAAAILSGAVIFGLVSYWAGTAQLKRSLDAVELPYARAPGVYQRLAWLTERMDVQPPSLLVARLPVPNAFAIGGSQGAIVVDRRLFGFLSGEELEALLAHELAHLENRDALVQTIAYSLFQNLVGLLVLLVLPVAVLAGGVARALALIRGTPERWSESQLGRVQRNALGVVSLVGLALTLVVLAYSRRREWAADDRAATVTGNPLALARALRKIERASTPDLGLLTPLYVHGEDDSPLSQWLSTHPPMDDRIERLVERADRERTGRFRG
ncbi:M48 family metallopeptidase [Halomicroarcula sp. GCM10025324]|uniref:M48 family metallopeptidase n=1 Tax=Haloarcula TaxID=2237 RepID=UPI0023E88FBA|nr:M48 family metalloprotease [Halomicroarcula sp. ZS-22-S1]